MTSRHDSVARILGLSITLVHAAWILPARSDEPAPLTQRPKLKYQRWSGPINVPDPVAISVADNGDVYVTQTQRRKIQDLDIRAHKQWIPDDVGLASVEDKIAFYHRVLAVGGDQVTASKDVEDVNRDGTHDWRDLTVISEKIHRLVDADGDGVADDINLFAEDFRTEVTGIAAGVMHWKDSVWATIAPDVWKLTDTSGDGVADQREVIATGFGLHIAYAGHDMHGLAIGPDGKVYWSIGDKGIAVTTPEGKPFHYPNQGGVMRCNLDGSDFEVFAHGLRNVQEFAFDQYGNLFGVDNDADQPDEKERFVWIVDQMDAGWRCNYQYRGDDYNPWTDEKLWQVPGEEHAAYIVPPIQNYMDGPAGFKFNPGAALSSAYRDFFFMTSAPNGSQYAFRTEPKGDSFRMAESHSIGSGDPIVGIAFAPDGGLYGADWGGGYPLTQSGSVIRIDVPDDELSDADRDDRNSVRMWLQKGLKGQSLDVLEGLLSHVDQRIRLRSQFELVAEGKLGSLRRVLADEKSSPLARIHCVWGIGQLIRSGSADTDVLTRFLSDDDPRIRQATAKTLGETASVDPAVFLPLLSDPDIHVRVHAALALGRRPSGLATDRLLEIASELAAKQHYMRHAVVTALAACSPAEQLIRQGNSRSISTRLCAVLALRRQGDEAVARFLADPSDWVATEAARAIHDDFSIPEAMEDLAAALDQSRNGSVPMTLRCVNANFRLGGDKNADRLMRFAADENRPVEMRLAACEALGHWLAPPPLDRVDGRRRHLEGKRILDHKTAANVLTGLVTGSKTDLRVAAVRAARQLGIELQKDALMILALDDQSPEPLRLEALKSVANDSSLKADAIVKQLVALSGDRSSRIASQSIELLGGLNADEALVVINHRMNSGSVAIRQACIGTLAEMGSEESDARIASLVDQFLAGTLPESLHLDVWQAVSRRKTESETLRNKWDQLEQKPELARIESPKLREFAMAIDGGDARRGESLFRTDLRAQCSRCHRIGKKGSNIGPELTKIAKQRDGPHLLRAIVSPSADIEKKYNAQSLLLADGSVIRGVIQSENDTVTLLIDSDGKEIKIPTDEIEGVSKSKVSLMPDMTAVLSPTEVRDLVAYLKTLR